MDKDFGLFQVLASGVRNHSLDRARTEELLRLIGRQEGAKAERNARRWLNRKLGLVPVQALENEASREGWLKDLAALNLKVFPPRS